MNMGEIFLKLLNMSINSQLDNFSSIRYSTSI